MYRISIPIRIFQEQTNRTINLANHNAFGIFAHWHCLSNIWEQKFENFNDYGNAESDHACEENDENLKALQAIVHNLPAWKIKLYYLGVCRVSAPRYRLVEWGHDRLLRRARHTERVSSLLSAGEPISQRREAPCLCDRFPGRVGGEDAKRWLHRAATEIWQDEEREWGERRKASY